MNYHIARKFGRNAGVAIGNYTTKPSFAKLTLKHSIIIHVEQEDQKASLQGKLG